MWISPSIAFSLFPPQVDGKGGGKKKLGFVVKSGIMGNAGSMEHHADLRGHSMPLKLPMPDPGELEERFAIVLVRKKWFASVFPLFAPCSGARDPGTPGRDSCGQAGPQLVLRAFVHKNVSLFVSVLSLAKLCCGFLNVIKVVGRPPPPPHLFYCNFFNLVAFLL